MTVLDPELSRFVVGIDLGTTNSAVAFVDTAEKTWVVRDFAVPQLVAPGVVEARETLPSFHYEAAEGEFAAGALDLPWGEATKAGDCGLWIADCGLQKNPNPQSEIRDPKWTVGFFARDHGASVPGRLVVSAKSWLSHSGVDRTAELLPWHGAADVQKLSPVEVSARYLGHIRAAWDSAHPAHPLSQQDVILTVPASFDEVARELTVEAAKRAGFSRLVLLEEPQAAFYAWINSEGEAWQSQVSPGQTILVCDIGGGTTDFTLISVRAAAEAGKVLFHRIAVGQHLILGGDNMDLALAYHVEKRLGQKLDPRAWAQLVRSCRVVKETLLGDARPEKYTLSLATAGSRLIGGARQMELSREEIERVLVEGFLPRVGIDEKPAARRSGFQEFGLPYAADAGITRYLGAFLEAHGDRGLRIADCGSKTPNPKSENRNPKSPDLVLFNGGFFASPVLRQRLLDVLRSWFPGEAPSRVLRNDRLDLAVARGAAYYGMVRRGFGTRISGGLAQSYYIGVESAGAAEAQAVCLLPAGVEEGQSVDLPERTFNLLIRQPVEFPLFVSSTRTTDKPGQIVTLERELMTPLPPIRTVLQSGRKTTADTVAVHLHARRTEIGTLELWCTEARGERQWKLQFDVRAATRAEFSGHAGAAEVEGFVDAQTVEKCAAIIRDVFPRSAEHGRGARATTDRSTIGRATNDRAAQSAQSLVKRLEEATGASRHDWPTSLLRELWQALMTVEAGRRISETHEARWLNLLGFALRPGYGLAVDDWRVAQTWRLFPSKVAHIKNELCRAEWWILWRRIAGGLAAGQQKTLAEPLVSALRSRAARTGAPKGHGIFQFGPHESAEAWRLLGSLELLPVSSKSELGDLLLSVLKHEKTAAVRQAAVWAIGRIGTRVPVYGTLDGLVSAEQAERWARALVGLAHVDASFAAVQLTRLTGDRYRDVSDAVRGEMAEWLASRGAPSHYAQLVREGGQLGDEEQRAAFGETLPRGLRID